MKVAALLRTKLNLSARRRKQCLQEMQEERDEPLEKNYIRNKRKYLNESLDDHQERFCKMSEYMNRNLARKRKVEVDRCLVLIQTCHET